MGGGTKLAIGILVMWLAMLFFFFAFHPHGVDLEQDNPVGMLKWIMNEFANETGASVNGVAPVTSAQAAAAPNNAGAAPTETGA